MFKLFSKGRVSHIFQYVHSTSGSPGAAMVHRNLGEWGTNMTEYTDYHWSERNPPSVFQFSSCAITPVAWSIRLSDSTEEVCLNQPSVWRVYYNGTLYRSSSSTFSKTVCTAELVALLRLRLKDKIPEITAFLYVHSSIPFYGNPYMGNRTRHLSGRVIIIRLTGSLR